MIGKATTIINQLKSRHIKSSIGFQQRGKPGTQLGETKAEEKTNNKTDNHNYYGLRGLGHKWKIDQCSYINDSSHPIAINY